MVVLVVLMGDGDGGIDGGGAVIDGGVGDGSRERSAETKDKDFGF